MEAAGCAEGRCAASCSHHELRLPRQEPRPVAVRVAPCRDGGVLEVTRACRVWGLPRGPVSPLRCVNS